MEEPQKNWNPEDLWDAFADFVAFEGDAGGPSPNLKLIAAAAEPAGALHREDRNWLACCYAAVYNTPSAVQLYNDWPLLKVLRAGESKLGDWLSDHWDGIVIHSNRRRTHANPYKLAQGMLHLARFADADEYERGADYDQLWSDVQSIGSVGRYFGIKLAGTLHALDLTKAQQYDIRPRGAKNGRKTLGLLFSDPKLFQKAGNQRPILEHVDHYALTAKVWLGENGLDTSWFQYEALLCEFNQMVKGDRYPQKTSDADWDALEKVTEYFGVDHPAVEVVMTARESVLPAYATMVPKRKRLLGVYHDHGYVWSDSLYDDAATEDLADPVRLDVPRTDWEPRTTPRGAEVATSA